MRFVIEPLDTLFFRDGTPFNAGETQFLDSVFPPTPRTIQGFLRTAILESIYDSWDKYYTDCKDGGNSNRLDREVISLIGDSEILGKLWVSAPYLVVDPRVLFKHLNDNHDEKWLRVDWLEVDEENGGISPIILYPKPEDLLIKAEGGVIDDIVRYKVKSGVPSDLVGVPFPYFDESGDKNIKDYKTGGWLSVKSLNDYLSGGEMEPDNLQILTDDMLYVKEPRVGIGRNNSTRAVDEGLLYSINQVRLRPGVSIGFEAKINGEGGDDLPENAIGVRKFGGEGKLVNLRRGKDLKDVTPPNNVGEYFRLVFLSPADFGGSWLPKSAQGEIYKDGWPVSCNCTGEMVNFRIISACTGKAVGIGARTIDGNPKTSIRRCVPAGSVYYCEKAGEWDFPNLHGKCLGHGNRMGFGQVVIGSWEGVTKNERNE